MSPLMPDNTRRLQLLKKKALCAMSALVVNISTNARKSARVGHRCLPGLLHQIKAAIPSTAKPPKHQRQRAAEKWLGQKRLQRNRKTRAAEIKWLQLNKWTSPRAAIQMAPKRQKQNNYEKRFNQEEKAATPNGYSFKSLRKGYRIKWL